MLEVFLNLKRDLMAHGFLRFVRGTGDVRRQDDIVHFLKRRIFQRLLYKHIQRGSSYLSFLQRARQGHFIHQFATRAIHQADAALHLLYGFRVDHVLCLRSQANMKR